MSSLPTQYPTNHPSDPNAKMPIEWHVAVAAAEATQVQQQLDQADPGGDVRSRHHAAYLEQKLADVRGLRDMLTWRAAAEGITLRRLIGELAERHNVPGAGAAEALRGHITVEQLDDTITEPIVATISTHLAQWRQAHVQDR